MGKWMMELKKRDSYILVYPDENLFVDSIQPIRLYLYNDGLVRLILITLHLLSSQKSFRRQCLIKVLLSAQHKPPVGSIYNRKVLFVTFLLIYGSMSVFMGIHGSRLVVMFFHGFRSFFMVPGGFFEVLG